AKTLWSGLLLPTTKKKFFLVRLLGTGTERVNAKRYTNFTLKGPLVLACELEELHSYQVVEDNAEVHNAKATTAVHVSNGIQRKFHPPLSRKLNPIEKAWRALKASLCKPYVRETGM
ncbi:hypothetical protein OC835_006270, partial [Tilletia horrida]